MALIICRECENEFSSRAPACPKCGDPVETNNPPAREAQKVTASVSTPISQFLFIAFNSLALLFLIVMAGDTGFWLAAIVVLIPWLIGNLVIRVIKSVEKGMKGT